MKIGQIIYSFKGSEERFSFIGLNSEKSKELLSIFEEEHPEFEDVRTEFAKALLLGKIPGCVATDIRLLNR